MSASASTGTASAGTAGTGSVAARPLRRRSDGRLVGGVAGGVADHLGLDPLHVRLAFALLSGLNAFGLVLYAALWIFVPVEGVRADGDAEPAGLAAATRSGRRSVPALPSRTADVGQLVALGSLGAGVLLLLAHTSVGVSPALAWPLLLAGAGAAVIWTLGDDRDRRRLAALPPRIPLLGRLAPSGLRPAVRILLGGLLVAAGVITFLASRGELARAGDGLLATGVVLLGLVVVTGPFLWRLVRERDDERRERIVNQERADVAAHLHDSVLQTLALIQRRADDPRAVVGLARAQERDLRDWLYGTGGEAATSVAAALRQLATQVEAAHGVPVELVTVGDAPLDDATTALVAATREATVNAARHSAAPVVDVFAEVGDDAVEVFVRDRGKGFDLDAVPEDRLGVRRSVIARVERHGGRASVRAAPGAGTEVRMSVRRESS